MAARNHHYIPQCYLNGFVANKKAPKLYVIDFKEKKKFWSHPRNVASNRDFNRIEIDGYKPDAIENSLSKFEGELSIVLDRVISKQSISNDDDFSYLINLICLVYVRNPRLRSIMASFDHRVMKGIMHAMTANESVWLSHIKRAKAAGYIDETHEASYETIRDALREDAFKFEYPVEHYIANEFETINEILPLLFKRQWSLLISPENSHGFITSDNPFCLLWKDGDKSLFPPGIGLRQTEILFPISKHLALSGSFEGAENSIHLSFDQVLAFNATIMDFATRQIYACDDGFHKDFPPEKPRWRSIY